MKAGPRGAVEAALQEAIDELEVVALEEHGQGSTPEERAACTKGLCGRLVRWRAALAARAEPEPGEGLGCSPRPDGDGWRCATHKTVMIRTCVVGYRQAVERQIRASPPPPGVESAGGPQER